MIDRFDLHPNYDEFQGVIDRALRKDRPVDCIPWSGGDIPEWARSFKPDTVLDLGAAWGKFTSSVLSRLKDWGCLDELQHLHLVESEPWPCSDGKSDVQDQMKSCLYGSMGGTPSKSVEILLSNEVVRVSRNDDTKGPRIFIGREEAEPADLIILSHFSYYFTDGGIDLLTGIESLLRSSGGLAWLVVRRRNCPLYRERQKRLAVCEAHDEIEDTYAEDLEECLKNAKPGLQIVDSRDQSFLAAADLRAIDIEAASLLMWRRPLSLLNEDERAALEDALNQTRPLFSERHFIVKSAWSRLEVSSSCE